MAAPTLAFLERLLVDAFGRPAPIARLEPIAPWSVARCHLKPGADLPPSVVAKWRREDATLESRADLGCLATEKAALQFLAEIGFATAPRLIAADLDAGVLILEDLAPRISLADRLRSEGAVSLKTELAAFARALGELGAASAGGEAAWDRLRRDTGPLGGPAGHLAALDPGWPEARARLGNLGLEMSGEAEHEEATIAEALSQPGAFRTFSNGDPHPNNFLVGEGGGRLIDFESASFSHALASAVWIHTPDPAWITAAQSMSGELEDTFRVALASALPEADDDGLFSHGLATCCLAWALTRFARFERLDARPAGDRSRLQMVATLELAAAAARKHRALPALAGWAERSGEWLRRRWPDADVDLADYRAFTPR